MEIATANSPAGFVEDVLALLRKDPILMTNYLLPDHQDFQDDDQWMATILKTDLEEIRRSRQMFLISGLWTHKDGKLKVAHNYIDFRTGLSENKMMQEFLIMASNNLSLLSDKGPCWFGSIVVSTTHELKREFVTSVRESLMNFIEKSKAVEKTDTILAWTHSSVDVLKTLEKNAHE